MFVKDNHVFSFEGYAKNSIRHSRGNVMGAVGRAGLALRKKI